PSPERGRVGVGACDAGERSPPTPNPSPPGRGVTPAHPAPPALEHPLRPCPRLAEPAPAHHHPAPPSAARTELPRVPPLRERPRQRLGLARPERAQDRRGLLGRHVLVEQHLRYRRHRPSAPFPARALASRRPAR